MPIFGKRRRLSAIYQKFSHSLMVLAFTKSGLKKFGSGFLFKILNDFNSITEFLPHPVSLYPTWRILSPILNQKLPPSKNVLIRVIRVNFTFCKILMSHVRFELQNFYPRGLNLTINILLSAFF